MTRLVSTVAGLILLLGASTPAFAGGYDTPMLYSARHMGMGGTAAAYVDDPSALFHNPAGLGQINKISLLADFSLLLGGITASPSTDATNIDSELVVAPFFLVGGGIRITDFMTLGLAIYPVASASASYKYKSSTGASTEDSTKLVFLEGTLGAGFNIDAIGLRLGAGYRVTMVTLARDKTEGGTKTLGFDMTGYNFLGFRVGAQWDAIPELLSIGLSYRHKTTTEVTQDSLTVPPLFGGKATDGSTEFTLPGRIIFGMRGDYSRFGAALDVEYAFNSQNDASTFNATRADNGKPVTLENIFEWDDAVTLRIGGEYRHPLGNDWAQLIPRLGFIFDARTSNPQYPTAFGTPPGHTYVLTTGLGFEHGPYRANVAYGFRFGSAKVTQADLAAARRDCGFCAVDGDYSIYLNGIYFDFSYDFK